MVTNSSDHHHQLLSELKIGHIHSYRITSAAIKDVPTSIPKRDLLCVTMAVIHVARQRFLAV